MSALKIALLTDVFARANGEVVDGVANTLRRFAEHCARRYDERELRLTVFTHGQAGASVSREGPVEVLRYRPLLPLAIHPRWRMDVVPCRRRVLEALRSRRPHLIHIASPGAMGLTGVFAGHTLGVPLFGSYHTAYEENIRRRVEKLLKACYLPYHTVGRLFDRLTWRYVTWILPTGSMSSSASRRCAVGWERRHVATLRHAHGRRSSTACSMTIWWWPLRLVA
jgi:hypothetical protein